MKYRNKQIVIEAMQYTENMWEDSGFHDFCCSVARFFITSKGTHELMVNTHKGKVNVFLEDYIALHPDGEYRVYNPIVFHQFYEPYNEGE